MDVIKPKESVDQPSFNTEAGPLAAAADMNMIPLRSFFGVNNPDRGEQEQLNYVYKFYDKMGVENMSQLLINLNLLKSQLGVAPLHTPTLTHIYNYLKVLNQIGELEQIKMGMLR